MAAIVVMVDGVSQLWLVGWILNLVMNGCKCIFLPLHVHANFHLEQNTHLTLSARLKAWPGHQTDEQDLWTSSAIKIGHLLVTGIKVDTHQQAAVLDSLMVEDRPVTDLGEQQSVK